MSKVNALFIKRAPLIMKNYSEEEMGSLPAKDYFREAVQMKRPVVLLVDDDPQVLETLKFVLGESYDPICAKSGVEAVSTVKNQSVDIVLMDLQLPGMGGLEALKLIKEYDSGIGVLVLSASDSAEQAVLALRLGAYDYLTRPFERISPLPSLRGFSAGFRFKTKS